MSLSEPLLNPLTPMPLPQFYCGCQRVNICVVASASSINIRNTNHDGRAPTSSIYHIPIPTNLPITTGVHTTLIFQTFLYSISRYVIGHVTLGWGIQPHIKQVPLLNVLR